MAKKKKAPIYKLGDESIPSIITAATNKKGRIKMKNEKQQKIMVGACVHHMVTKKNKLRPTLRKDEKGRWHCTMCLSEFRAKMFSKNEVKDRVNPVKEIVSQSKFFAVAFNTGENAIRFFSELGSMLELLPGHYNKLAKITQKRTTINKKKKKKDTEYQALGSWK